ncbi:hypothetical protein HQ447_13415 [bacterium]|nr:hypothetical protein [bacterium]
MQRSNFPPRRKPAAGFTLPAILVVVGALLILAVGILLVVGIERSTSRAFSDRERANLAARAGLEEVKGIFSKEAANDDFLIPQGPEIKATGAAKDPAPYLYLARGSGGGNTVNYRYVPLFSAEKSPPTPTTGSPLKAPEGANLIGTTPKSVTTLTTLPWYDPATVSWVTIRNPDGKQVSRYAYWVEDLQGKIDGHVAGNADGAAGLPTRAKFPDPSAKPVVVTSPPLSALAIHVLDPKAQDLPVAPAAGEKSLTQKVIDGRVAMISPGSIIAATAILDNSGGGPALPRDETTGLLTNPTAAALEREVSAVNKPYLEQPMVPFLAGLAADVTGKPKKNLNKLLTDPRGVAVDEMASWIDKAMPDFKKRRGGFPDDYLKTLAAGAMDYADTDSAPTTSAGSYSGLDSYPLLSEIALHIDFLGRGKVGSRYVLYWRLKLFAELWNMTNQEITNGSAQLSYEENLKPDVLGGGAPTFPFDDSGILSDLLKSKHNLTKIGDKFYGPLITGINLLPDEYTFYEFASVNYTLDYTPQLDAKGSPISESFDLIEKEADARGITLRWNNEPVQTLQGIVRDAYGVENFMTATPRKAAKAAIPGHSYGPYGFFANNMGDPRIASYLRTTRLGENAYPENLSPGRRNIRRGNIYDGDSKEKRLHYGRVLPSEWPDGGHDSPTGAFNVTTDNAILPISKTQWPSKPTPSDKNAPQRISNLGRFYSATELGRIYDPILWSPTYKDLKSSPGSGKTDTETLTRVVKPNMPTARNAWPEVTANSTISTDFGGGNTLRIGRPEHELFEKDDQRATQLLNLFHTGIASSENATERGGLLVEVKGNININTAGKDALRAMAAGLLQQDPEMRRVTSWEHDSASSGLYRPKSSAIELGTPTVILVADQIADALMLRRPFASASEMAAVLDKNDDPIFGNRDIYTTFKDIQWSDAAAEELFSRVYDASTVRSRNLRVWVIGQALAGTDANPEVLAESRKVFTLFADPGVRKPDGSIDPAKYHPKVTHENDF